MRCGSWPPKVRVAHTRRAADPAAEVCSPRQPPDQGGRGEHLSELLHEGDEIRTLDQRATVVPPTTAVGVSNAAARSSERGGGAREPPKPSCWHWAPRCRHAS